MYAIRSYYGCGSTESVSQTGNTQNESFNKAKDLLLNKVYDTHRVTFYCGCAFTKNKKVRCKTGEGERASRIEWEHIVPASRFGQTFDSWKKYESMTCKLPAFIRKMLGLKCQRFSTRENAQRVSQAYRLVITSYSIHYTKLYEGQIRGCRGSGRRPATAK